MAKKNIKIKAAKIFTATNIIYACVILIALAAAVALAVMGRAKPIVIPDENGEESYSLAVLTENEICAEEPKYSCKIFGVSLDGDAENANDSEKIVAEAKTDFSGVVILQKTECETEKVTFTVNCERAAGNLRVVLLDENLRVVHNFAVGESSSFTVSHAKGNTFQLRVAGESAVFTVIAERTFE